ncbi:MAG: 1-acyl-sn-glycerol-3-phosphate acyltransferase [Alphaproteobacteria bacterium]|nr:MAG: 1-acyl-sn-glycerol-3-phosphate acyltransferase [Alphaproteobacteria bacterium]
MPPRHELLQEHKVSGLFNAVRSILFNLSFYLFTIVYCGLFMVPLCLLSSDGPVRRAVLFYCQTSIWLARWIMGVRLDLRNIDLLPKSGAYILCAAHQSYMDPIIVYCLRKDVTALAKKELFSLPLVGTVLKKIKIVRIDRQSHTAHQGMEAVASHVVELGRPLIVYPQATRVPIGQSRRLKSGSYYLQTDTGLPVYTVATNTGLFWSKGFWHRPGTAVFEVTGQVPAGLDKDAFMAALDEKVVRRSAELITEAGYGKLLEQASS